MKNFSTVSRVITALEDEGSTQLPGLTRWLDLLSPSHHVEAWSTLSNPVVANLLVSLPGQRRHFFLNDQGEINPEGEFLVTFRDKPEKSYLTVVEGCHHLVTSSLLPSCVQVYLEKCQDFMEEIHDYLSDCLPPSTLPSLLKLRIFDYHATDPLVEMRPNFASMHAMRPHVDGSICTLVIAPSDRRFRFQHASQWYIACREDQRAFALLLPGMAANHDLGMPPTPHMVLPGLSRRSSVTVFWGPDLGHTNLEQAEAHHSQWRLWQPNIR